MVYHMLSILIHLNFLLFSVFLFTPCPSAPVGHQYPPGKYGSFVKLTGEYISGAFSTGEGKFFTGEVKFSTGAGLIFCVMVGTYNDRQCFAPFLLIFCPFWGQRFNWVPKNVIFEFNTLKLCQVRLFLSILVEILVIYHCFSNLAPFC